MKTLDLFTMYTEALQQQYACHHALEDLARHGIGTCDPDLLRNLHRLAAQQREVWQGLARLENPFYYLLATTPAGLGETDLRHEVVSWSKYVDIPTWVPPTKPPQKPDK
jgi:hypothetical protein